MSIQQLGDFRLLAPRFTLYKEAIAFIGFDLTGATFKMQVRSDWNVPGTPMIDLGNAASSVAQGLRVSYAGTATIDAHIAAGRMSRVPDGMVGTQSILLTIVTIRINKSTMSALDFPEDHDEDYPAVMDIWITPSGGDEERWVYGDFIIQRGSTQ